MEGPKYPGSLAKWLPVGLSQWESPGSRRRERSICFFHVPSLLWSPSPTVAVSVWSQLPPESPFASNGFLMLLMSGCLNIPCQQVPPSLDLKPLGWFCCSAPDRYILLPFLLSSYNAISVWTIWTCLQKKVFKYVVRSIHSYFLVSLAWWVLGSSWISHSPMSHVSNY